MADLKMVKSTESSTIRLAANPTDSQRKLFNTIMNNMGNGKPRALTDIPTELLAIDMAYQTEIRTGSRRERGIQKLTKNWTENKLEPITVVPHPEECLFYIVNGYGRWQASQRQNPAYEYLCAIVLLNAPSEFDER
jgi:hypothetical protein